MTIDSATFPIARPAAASPQIAYLANHVNEAADALETIQLSALRVKSPARGSANPLQASTCDTKPTSAKIDVADAKSPTTASPHQESWGQAAKKPHRRDSLERRQALLKGKEGSRQRRRWENDRLLDNPWAQPPLPIDWEVQPTYRRQVVPYFLAPLWDADAFHRNVDRKMKNKRQTGSRAGVSPAEEAASNVPKEVRSRLKQARAAKGLLQHLEGEVRNFLQEWREKEAKRRQVGLEDIDSDEEEIVFVGRNGRMHDIPHEADTIKDPGRDKLIFDGLANAPAASFARWLVHSIATYYGLRTWSLTTGDPARREAYVGVAERTGNMLARGDVDLPRPLWAMV